MENKGGVGEDEEQDQHVKDEKYIAQMNSIALPEEPQFIPSTIQTYILTVEHMHAAFEVHKKQG